MAEGGRAKTDALTDIVRALAQLNSTYGAVSATGIRATPAALSTAGAT